MLNANRALETVVVINDFSHVNGGASQVALTSAKGLASAGYRVILFCAVAPLDPTLAEAGVRIVHTGQYESIQDPNPFRAAIQGIWNAASRRRLKMLLRTLDPNRTVIHVHSWVKALSSSIVRESAAQKFVVLCTLHDYFAACPNGGFFDYQRGTPCGEVAMSFACVRRNCDARSYSQKLWRVARQAVQINVGRMPDDVTHFISVSQFSEDILRRYLPSTARIHRVANPIEAEAGHPTDLSLNNGYVYVGRLSPEKGAISFAAAAAKLAVPAVFVGDGADAQRILAAYPSADVTGWLPRQLVMQKIRCARALVMPSLWYETQGLVVAEAASQGVPSIVSNRCAARDSVVDGDNGFLFDGNDIDDLARKMTFMQELATAKRLGARAHEKYWANPMTLKRHVETLEVLYTRCLEQRTAGQISAA